MGIQTFKQIIELLTKQNCVFKHLSHKSIQQTSLAAAALRGTNLSDGAKALVLKTKSGNFIQIVIPADKRADLKKVKRVLEEKNISLAHPDEVFSLTNCVVGSVPPFGIFWDIPVYVDNQFLEKDLMVFSAGTLEDSISLAPKEYIRVVKPILKDLSKETA